MCVQVCVWEGGGGACIALGRQDGGGGFVYAQLVGDCRGRRVHVRPASGGQHGLLARL